ncbi:MAG: phospholipid transport system substrate-binding protein [Acetobacteraceae bacterium]|jgi:phospholipid transport system substrate-binding protein|nr:phospholipid transport system substrate-binding protein [Acetobacteraceae bacterium]MEA2771764.1 phospholipid transport system substrate-binding protein [Acetobacteraceae bacterium]
MNTSYCRRRGLMVATAAVFIGAVLPARAVDIDGVTAPIQQLVDGLLQVMKAGAATPFPRRFEMLAPIMDRTFDLTAILQESVGATWATLPPDQQTMLTQAFRRYTVASYVNSFDGFDGQQFVVSPNTRAVGNDQVVQTRIIPKAGEGHELDYVMREGGSGWRAVDVLADGSISRVAVQRSDFRRLLARGGAQALVTSLRSKSVDLSDGSS